MNTSETEWEKIKEELISRPLINDLTGKRLQFTDQDLRNIYLPLSDWLLKRTHLTQRSLTAVAGPPGIGKSAFIQILSEILCIRCGKRISACAGMDGWHYSREYLQSHTICKNGQEISLAEIKGSPESFDQAGFLNFVHDIFTFPSLKFPIYSRLQHEPIPDAGTITPENQLIFLEGNYLLLDEPQWNTLFPFYSSRIFLFTEKEKLLDGLLQRKISGGTEPEAARRHVMHVDAADIDLVLQKSTGYDLKIIWNFQDKGKNQILPAN